MKVRRAARPQRRVDGILLLDKPLGLSSNDALQRVKHAYRATRAGHTGSLDPLATGLLPICLGEATKLCGLLLDGDKHYRATLRLGWSTTTGDAEGEVLERSDPGALTEADWQALLPRFLGTIQQVPPMYSAIKREGQPLYALARQGIEVERPPRSVRIDHLAISGFTGDGFELEVRCSKGTYIRTLAEDLARALGQRAHLAALRRVGAEPFESPEMRTLDQIEAAAAQGLEALDGLLLPPVAGVAHWPQWVAGAEDAAVLARGQTVAVPAGPAGPVAVLDASGALLGLARRGESGRLQPERWFLPA